MHVEAHTQTVLVHLASGVGNIVLATPLLLALNHMEFVVDLLIHADYPQTADLLRDWSVIRAVYDDRSQNITTLGMHGHFLINSRSVKLPKYLPPPAWL